MADREGRLEDRPKRIKAEILPYDECDIENLLSELVSKKEPDGTPAFILRYSAGGNRYIQVLNFSKHQNPHCKEAKSTIPAPCQHSTSTVLEEEQHQKSTELAGLTPDSLLLTPDSIKPYVETSIEFQLAKLLLDLIVERKPDIKKPDVQKWALHIDRMIRLDSRDPEIIGKVIRWCQADDFWQNNILSTSKLRIQFDQLELKMKKTQEDEPQESEAFKRLMAARARKGKT